MSRTSIIELISDLLITRYEVEPTDISPDKVFEDLSLDSLALMEIALVLEKRLGVSIAEGTLTPEQTLGEAAMVLHTLQPA